MREVATTKGLDRRGLIDETVRFLLPQQRNEKGGEHSGGDTAGLIPNAVLVDRVGSVSRTIFGSTNELESRTMTSVLQNDFWFYE